MRGALGTGIPGSAKAVAKLVKELFIEKIKEDRITVSKNATTKDKMIFDLADGDSPRYEKVVDVDSILNVPYPKLK